ncbi:MAG: FAD-dependent oxidoreductase [Thaumarchaeota archaeon]|nr:FAD-dependent oxidoreductase [Nitrososphaerota archaeon]
MDAYDVVVIGGGCVGCSTIYHLSQQYQGKFLLIEKEYQHAMHTSNVFRNSGTIHDGATEDYVPGTKKYVMSPSGARKLIDYCKAAEKKYKKNLAKKVGKMVVDSTREKLDKMEEGSNKIGFDVRVLGRKEIEKIQPIVVREREERDQVFALYHSEAHIIDSSAYVDTLVGEAKEKGAEFAYSTKLTGLKEKDGLLEIETSKGNLLARYVVNSAGMHAITIARELGVGDDYTLIPVRGDFFEIVGAKATEITKCIYQAPVKSSTAGTSNPQHFHPSMHGKTYGGPTAVPIYGMELYAGKPEENAVDSKYYLLELAKATLGFSGFWKLLMKGSFWEMSYREFRKSVLPERWALKYFLQDARKLIPSLEKSDLVKSPHSGIRAQPLDKQGNMVPDIQILYGRNSSHYFSPSPALSLSITLGENESARIATELDLKPL